MTTESSCLKAEIGGHQVAYSLTLFPSGEVGFMMHEDSHDASWWICTYYPDKGLVRNQGVGVPYLKTDPDDQDRVPDASPKPNGVRMEINGKSCLLRLKATGGGAAMLQAYDPDAEDVSPWVVGFIKKDGTFLRAGGCDHEMLQTDDTGRIKMSEDDPLMTHEGSNDSEWFTAEVAGQNMQFRLAKNRYVQKGVLLQARSPDNGPEWDLLSVCRDGSLYRCRNINPALKLKLDPEDNRLLFHAADPMSKRPETPEPQVQLKAPEVPMTIGDQGLLFSVDKSSKGELVLNAKKPGSGVFRVLRIGTDGRIYRYECLPDTIGFPTNPDGAMALSHRDSADRKILQLEHELDEAISKREETPTPKVPTAVGHLGRQLLEYRLESVGNNVNLLAKDHTGKTYIIAYLSTSGYMILPSSIRSPDIPTDSTGTIQLSPGTLAGLRDLMLRSGEIVPEAGHSLPVTQFVKDRPKKKPPKNPFIKGVVAAGLWSVQCVTWWAIANLPIPDGAMQWTIMSSMVGTVLAGWLSIDVVDSLLVNRKKD